MMKRTLAFLLTLVLMVGMLPLPVQAEEPQATVDNGDVTIEGSNGFGTLLSQEITESQSESAEEASDYEAGYAVTDLTIEGDLATVEYSSQEDAMLAVALYSEDGLQMLASGQVKVSADEDLAYVSIEGELPEYFLASAYLMDTYDLSPLCPAYDTPMYTQEMQELLASTIHDYDADRVLNLDEDETTNFAVYAEDTIVIEGGEGVNTVASVDDEHYTYVIENADEQITFLAEEDVFVYPYGEDEMLIVKVASIEVNGTTVTITGSDELEMEEVFDFAKIQGTGVTSDMIVDENSGDEGVTYTGMQAAGGMTPAAWGDDAELNFSMGFKVEKKIDDYSSVSGSLNLQFDLEFEYYISLKRQYVRFEYGTELAIKVAYEFKENSPAPKATSKLKLKSFGYSPVTGVFIGFEPEVIVEFTATVEVSCTLRTSGGFSFEFGKGADNLAKKPKVDIDIKFEGMIFFGIDLGPHISILKDKVAKIKLSSQVGLELTGKTTGSLFEDITIIGEAPEEMHDCELCISVELAAKAEFSLSIELLKKDWLSFETKLAAKRYKLGMLYYSETHSDFGFGECPHKLYRLTVVVTDADAEAVPGATVTADEKQESTNDNGIAVIYVPEGTYTVTAVSGELSAGKSVQLDSASKVTICLSDEEEPDFDGILGDISTETIVDGVINGEDTYLDNRYVLYDISMSWTEAKAYCENLGGHLVTITSAEEQQFIETLMESGTKKQYWIGMYRNGNLEWVTGEDVSYTNWDSGEPNENYRYEDGESEDYMQIYNVANPAVYGSKRFKWNDIYVDNVYPGEEDYFSTCYVGFICEFETTGEQAPTLNAVYPGDYGTQITDTYTLKTASFKNLVPGEQYVLLSMVSIEVDNLLAADNLLYIVQAVAQEDGTLSFRYIQRIPMDVSYVVACGASNKNLADAEITFPEMTADGELQAVNPAVVYDGKTLTEGRDYTIVGTVSFTEAGTYTCYIRGIHNYTGLVECVYTVAEGQTYTPGDINDDGKVNNKDLTRLFQYLSNWEVEVVEEALDINGDGKVNNKDLTRLFQYLSNWDVEIF